MTPAPAATSTAQPPTTGEPFVRKAYLPMDLATAESTLKDDEPLFPEGTIQIGLSGAKVTIGYYGDPQGDKTYYRYRVKGPVGGPFRSPKWMSAIKYALDQARQIEMKCPSQTPEILRDHTALAFQQFTAVAAQGGMSPLELLQSNIQLGEAAGTKLKNTMKDIIKSTIINDTSAPLSELVSLGKIMKNILKKHPQLTETQVSASVEQLFPAKMHAGPVEILADLAEHKEFTANANTIKRYERTIATITKATRKPLTHTTPEDIRKIVKTKFVKRGPKGNEVRPPSFDSFISNAKALFNFLILKHYYPAILGNPVVVPLIGRGTQAPREEQILESLDLGRWINVSPWHVTPYVGLNGDGGIRPQTLEFVPWECIDWDARVIRVPAYASKTYKGVTPRLSDALYHLLLPFKNCKGAISVYEDTGYRAYQAAIEEGIFEASHDTGRKSAITYRAAELRGQEAAEKILTKEFDNSEEVRRLFYECFRTPEQAAIYRGYFRVFDPVVVSLAFARQYHRSQVLAQTRLNMRKLAVDRTITHLTDDEIYANVHADALAEAIELFKDGPSFPSFVTIADGATCGPVTLSRPKKSNLPMSDKAIAALNRATGEKPAQADFFQS